jgi:Cupin-like domain
MIEIRDASVFEAHYPERPALMRLQVESALFTRPRLVELADMLSPHLVEFNTGDLPTSIAPEDVPDATLSVHEVIEQIGECNSWMTLRNIEHHPDYRALAHEALAPLERRIVDRTGAIMQREAFFFISSSGAVTPFHFDEEHNILIQIEGQKTVTLFSQNDREISSQTDLERFHAGGHRNLNLDPAHEPRGQAVCLAPGDALYIPPLAPHWVKAEPGGSSLSLSVTWRSKASRRALYLHQINHALRARGFSPRFPGKAPIADQLKIWGASGLRRLKKLAGK